MNNRNNKEQIPYAVPIIQDPTKTLQKYVPTEHKEIGNIAMKALLESNPSLETELKDFINSETLLITLTKAVRLTPGEWVALAGDFYAIPEKPIAGLPHEELNSQEMQNRFIDAYLTLANISSESEKKELRKLLKVIKEEDEIVNNAKYNRDNVSEALHKHATESNKEYASITSDSIIAQLLVPHLPLAIIGLTAYTRYLAIAENNYDHFGKDAENAYAAGHEVALQTAALAHMKNNSGETAEAKELLVKALTQELFACHFLSDLFAAGHLRVPRKELYRAVGNAKVAGLLALMMHNEDGIRGLLVSNKNIAQQVLTTSPSSIKDNEKFLDDSVVEETVSKSWFAKGDGCLYDEGVEYNRQKVIQTISMALQAVYDHYKDPTIKSTFDFREYIPRPIEGNHPALFIATGEETVTYRGSANPDEGPRNYSHIWDAKRTLAKLWLFSKPENKEKEEEALVKELTNENEVQEDEKKQPKRRCVLF